MKSPMVETLPSIAEEDRKNYSELLVLRSAEGWYVGTIYTDPETGFKEPGSRDTGYYPTEKEASDSLLGIQRGEIPTRMEP